MAKNKEEFDITRIYETAKPYESKWAKQLNQTADKILGREQFSYDVNGDALYQQYKDYYNKQGKKASEDVMGQASALTGGYANSYAQTAANQAYQSSLDNLNTVIPELYQMAYDKYNKEGNELYDQYNFLNNLEQQNYNKWLNEVSSVNTQNDYYNSVIDVVKGMDSESEQSEYLAELVNQGKLDDSIATEILGSYSNSLTNRTWHPVSIGRKDNYWGDINDSAVVEDDFGNQYTLAELYKEMKKVMSASEAKDAIMEIQEELGLGKNTKNVTFKEEQVV